MKRAVVAFVALLTIPLAISAARSADLSPGGYAAPIAAAPLYSPIYRWSGFYLGINGGGAWGRSQWDGVDKFNISGGLIGGTIGYNWQFGTLLAGLEGDIDWSGVSGSTNVFCAAGCSTRNHWLATARGRLGYVFNRWVPYLTAGLALGDISATLPGFPGGSITNAGWTAGLGVEYGVLSNVSIKAEYLFVDLGNFNCGFNCALLASGQVSLFENVFRAGLNVRF